MASGMPWRARIGVGVAAVGEADRRVFQTHTRQDRDPVPCRLAVGRSLIATLRQRRAE
jgi:hypothetical protein